MKHRPISLIFASHGLTCPLPNMIAVNLGSLVCLYPGTVYQPYQSILLQSVRNQFLFRCADGVLVDGKDTAISSTIYRSGHTRPLRGTKLLYELICPSFITHSVMDVFFYLRLKQYSLSQIILYDRKLFY